MRSGIKSTLVAVAAGCIAAYSTVARHTHPGTLFGYLLAGDYTMPIDGQPAHTLRPRARRWIYPPAH
jgi:quercetin dioxygenase-like cupin family protein